MIKRFATVATTALLAAGALGSAAHAAGPHQASRSFSLNTLYGVTSNGVSGIPSNGKSATVSSYLLDRDRRSLRLAAGPGDPRHADRRRAGHQRQHRDQLLQPVLGLGSRQLVVSSTSPNTIIGLEARVCQTNSAGAQTGVCTQYLPINI